MTRIILLLCSIALAGISDTGTLTLEQAEVLALRYSPELRAARMHVRAAEKAVAAAGLWNSPQFEFEAEGVGGDRDGFSEAEYTVALSQKFQRGDKRGSRKEIALNKSVEAREVESGIKRALITEVRRAFIEVLAQQEAARVQAEQEELGRAFIEVARRRLEAGGGSELELTQAELALEEIILSQACCFGELQAAKETLASLIGVSQVELKKAEGSLYELDDFDGATLDESFPELQRLNAQIETLRSKAALAAAQDAADIKLVAGYQHEQISDESSFVLGFSLPLNVARQGRADQTALLLKAAALEADRTELRRRLNSMLAVETALYNGAAKEVELTKQRLMPLAEKAYTLSREGYEAGRFSWYELIAAQQRLADIRIRYIDALKEAHLAAVRLSNLMSGGMER